MPQVGAPKLLRNPALEGLRSWPVQGFEDIRIYYLIQGGTLKVARILHAKCDINRILENEPPVADTRD
jgi:toxin ParE1/3/4